MDFTYKNENGRRILYLNKTNTPGKPDGEFNFPSDKPSIMSALQELFDMIKWDKSEPREEAPGIKAEDPNQFIFIRDSKLTDTQLRNLRLVIDTNWDNMPLSYKVLLTSLVLDETVPLLNKLKEKLPD